MSIKNFTRTKRILDLYLKRTETDMSHSELAQVASNYRVSAIDLLTEPEMIHLTILLSNAEYQLYLIREIKQVALSMAYLDPKYNPLIKDAQISKLAQKSGISKEHLDDMSLPELETVLRLMKKKKDYIIKSITTDAMKATVAMLKEMNIKTTPSPQKHTK